jgi:DNA-binding NarL/FixJ family response regulator
MIGSEVLFANEVPRRPAGAKGRLESEAPDQYQPRIVIVDDEFLVAWHLQALLHDLDFEVCEIAGDAESAFNCVISQEADLVLMDLNLGDGADGLETLRRIREHRNVAVIFITAYADDANLRRIRQLAPDAPILSKPVSPEILLATIMRMFPDCRS